MKIEFDASARGNPTDRTVVVVGGMSLHGGECGDVPSDLWNRMGRPTLSE